MADLVPISNRFTTNIQNAVTDAAGADKIEQNHLILVQIRNSLQAQNKSFPLLDPYLQVLDQPDNQSLAIFLSICDSDQLQSMHDTIVQDPGSVEHRRAGRPRGWRRGRGRGQGDPPNWIGFPVHGLTRIGFTRYTVRYEGIRDNLS